VSAGMGAGVGYGRLHSSRGGGGAEGGGSSRGGRAGIGAGARGDEEVSWAEQLAGMHSPPPQPPSPSHTDLLSRPCLPDRPQSRRPPSAQGGLEGGKEDGDGGVSSSGGEEDSPKGAPGGGGGDGGEHQQSRPPRATRANSASAVHTQSEVSRHWQELRV
jgi:hypothetical protein